MKLKLILVCTIVSAGLVNAQNLKTYNGEFENGEYPKAKVIYNYYEDSKTLEYVKQGAFKYTKTYTSEGGTFNASFNGNFKKNKKEGTWTYIINENNCPHSNGLFYTGFTKLTANYKDGVPNGLWNYTCQLKYHEKKYNNTYGAYETLPNEAVSATFKDGHFVGQLSIMNNRENANYPTITGQFDDNGNPTGKWVFKNKEIEKIYQLQNGLITQVVEREISTGKVLFKDIDDTEMTAIKNDFLKNKLTKTDLDSLKIVVDTIPLVTSNQGMLWFGESFNNEIFKHEYIGGDLTYFYVKYETSNNNQKFGWNDSRNYGYMIRLTKTKQLILKEIETYNTAEQYFKIGLIIEAKEKYNILLLAYGDKISGADKQIILNKIKQCDETSLNKKRLEEAQEKFDKATQCYNKILNWEPPYSFLSVAQETIKLYDELLTIYKEFISAQYVIDITEKQNKCKNYIQKAEQEKLLADNISKDLKTIKTNEEEIISAFDVTIHIGEKTSVGKKEKLYNAYIDIHQDLNSKYKSATLQNDKLTILEKIILLQTKILSLAGSDTKAIEKQLKSAINVEEKMKILGL